MEKTDVIEICGQYPKDHKTVDISSIPNFIFENDPSFKSINIFDEIGNAITVNSFQECEHYVLGGWTGEVGNNYETEYQSFIVLTIFVFYLFKFTLKKIIMR